MEPTWEPLDDAERDAAWLEVDRRFRFRPSTKQFPGFAEPPDSVTFSLAGMFGDEERYRRVRHTCEGAALATFRGLVPQGSWLHALYWQHPGYRFRPHLPVEVDHLGDWTVPFLPNGDYYLFLEPECRFGTLGHPWEKTLCVFGEELIAKLGPQLQAVLGAPVRRGGRPVDSKPR